MLKCLDEFATSPKGFDLVIQLTVIIVIKCEKVNLAEPLLFFGRARVEYLHADFVMRM